MIKTFDQRERVEHILAGTLRQGLRFNRFFAVAGADWPTIR
jgi:hypothetical protein